MANVKNKNIGIANTKAAAKEQTAVKIKTSVKQGEGAKRLTARQKKAQLKKAENLMIQDSESIMTSMQHIRQAKNSKSSSLTERSIVNEQDVFGALVHNSLTQIDKSLAKIFKKSLPGLIANVAETDKENSVLRGVKRALRKLVDSKRLTIDSARELRKFALGKAQLDDDRTSLLTERSDSDSSETPVRRVSTAIKKIAENERASEEEFTLFKDFAKKLKAVSREGESGRSPEIERPAA